MGRSEFQMYEVGARSSSSPCMAAALVQEPPGPPVDSSAIKATDKDAKFTIDVAKTLVMVEPTDAHAQELNDAITEAGYTPVQAATVAAQPAKKGGCCGCCR